ncbi:hypothetical protein [Paenibacillus sp. GM2]|nr:hypothetical protein [Paenibacillus sp. GM2]
MSLKKPGYKQNFLWYNVDNYCKYAALAEIIAVGGINGKRFPIGNKEGY